MIIYNSQLMNNKQRFYKAIIFSLLAAIGCAVVFSLFVRITHITFSIFYLGTGYIIAKTINETGHGIGNKFRYLGAGMTFLSILLTEIFIIAGYDILLQPSLWFTAIRVVINSWSQFGYNNIISLLFMLWGIVTAYNNSSI